MPGAPVKRFPVKRFPKKLLVTLVPSSFLLLVVRMLLNATKKLQRPTNSFLLLVASRTVPNSFLLRSEDEQRFL